MGELQQQIQFDYEQLDAETRIVVRQKTGEIKTLIKRTAQDIIDIGTKLIEVKAELGHGNFGAWLGAEFDWNRKTAHKYMLCSQAFSNVQSSGHLNMGFETMAYLAAPSTPESARLEAIELSANGKRVTHTDAKRLAGAHTAPSGDITDESPAKARLANAINDAPAEVAEVAQHYGVYHPETVETLKRLHKNGAGTFDEVVRTGYIQPTGEDDAIHISESPAAVNLAIEKKSKLHKHTAMQARDLDAENGELPPYHGAMKSTNSTDNQRIDGLTSARPHVSNNSGNNEWYTPKRFIDAARRVMGGIDYDPASSDIANETVKAAHYDTIETNGLTAQWYGRVWMNPPYSQPEIKQFCEKLQTEYGFCRIDEACVLVNNATETAWFGCLLSCASAVCFIKSRVKFIDPDGNESGAPLQGQVVVYVGKNAELFEREFSEFGKVLHDSER